MAKPAPTTYPPTLDRIIDAIINRKTFALTDEEDEEQKVKYDVVDMFNGLDLIVDAQKKIINGVEKKSPKKKLTVVQDYNDLPDDIQVRGPSTFFLVNEDNQPAYWARVADGSPYVACFPCK